ncbi:hypothetical protein CPB84DRAFT_1770151 [Gymnopilus junonius]|uniref:Uncharacterized protein n=1 Tax=Gymnopilus junonius TaxID=109634 RepID=A0A9P5TRF0_GYMJU|nr:hypothetical protein CPB84DRAFT_1770151 [Gymnopilus junonius]
MPASENAAGRSPRILNNSVDTLDLKQSYASRKLELSVDESGLNIVYDTRLLRNARNTTRPRPLSLCPAAASRLEYNSQQLATPVSNRRFSTIDKTKDLITNAKPEQELNAGLDFKAVSKLLSCVDHRAHREAPGSDEELDISTHDDWNFSSRIGSTTDSVSISDGVPSLCDINAFDFPEPPPIGSPTIRRMRSSPWFMAACHADHNRSLSGSRWRSIKTENEILQSARNSYSPSIEALLVTDNEGKLSCHPGNENPYQPWESNTSNTSCLTDRPGAKVLSGEVRARAGLGLHVNVPHPAWPGRETSDGQITTHSSAPCLNSNRDRYHKSIVCTRISNNYCGAEGRESPSMPELQGSRSLGPLPRIIRKVASMKSDLQKVNHSDHRVSDNVRRTLPKARSFLQASGENKDTISRIPPTHEVHITEQSVQDQKTSRHSGLLAGTALPFKDQGLTTHDSRKATQDRLTEHFSYKKAFAQHEAMTSRSFIDFTPDKGERLNAGAKRERVRNFIAKASNVVLGLGRRKKALFDS